VFEKHSNLVALFTEYGFLISGMTRLGELRLEKLMYLQPILDVPDANILGRIRLIYPRFVDRLPVRKFFVPIRPGYHSRLFPEIARPSPLPLLPALDQSLILPSGATRTPGNTIRKVYVCRAKIRQLSSGDMLFFYMSRDIAYANSQCITTIGIVENTYEADSPHRLVQLTSKRSVFTQQELELMSPGATDPVFVIDFLLVGHLVLPLSLERLRSIGAIRNQPPQSIAEIGENTYRRLREHMRLDNEG